MATRTTTIGLQIEGLGAPGHEGIEEATAWAYRSWKIIPDASKPDQWQERHLEELPSGVSSSIDPFRREWANSAFTFRLPATEATLTTLFWQENTPFIELHDSITASETDIPIDLAGLDGQIVFVGKETIKLGTWVAGGGGSPGHYTDCTRGWWRSKQRAHDASAAVFSGPPKLKDRQVWIVQLDPVTRVLETKWTGFLRGVSSNETLSTVDVQCAEFFSTIAALGLNRNTKNLALLGGLERVQTTSRDYIRGFLPGYTPQMRKLDQDGAATVWLDVDGRLVRGIYNGRGVQVEDDGQFASHTPEFLDGDGEVFRITPCEEVYEVFVVSPELDEDLAGGPHSTTGALFNPYNRVAITYALLVSTIATTTSASPNLSLGFVEADIFGPAVALGLDEYLDHDSWWEAIAQAEQGIPVEQLEECFGGASPSIFEVGNNHLLAPDGFFYTITEAGLIGCARFEAPDIAAICEAFDNAIEIISPARGGIFKLDASTASSIDQVVAKVGERPWQKPSKVLINARSSRDATPDFGEPSRVTFDLRTIRRDRVAQSFDGDSGDSALLELLSFATLAHFAAPRLSVRTKSSSIQGVQPFDTGKWFSISGGWPEDALLPIPTRGGRPVVTKLPSEDEEVLVRLVGKLMSRRWDIKSDTYELELLLLSWRNALVARWRAPSMRVTSVDVGNRLLIGPSESDYGADIEDAQGFKPGDQVELWERDGQRWTSSVIRTVTDVIDEALELDDWYGASPQGTLGRDLIVRIAPSTDYSNDAHVTCFDRPWVHLANANDELEVLGDTKRADVYG